MENFFVIYKKELIYAAVVVISVAVLYGLTNVLHKFLVKKQQKRYPNEKPRTTNLVKRILNTLWIVLGIVAMSAVFVSQDKYDVLKENFNLAFYLGILSVITIVTATSANMWFTKSISKKVENKYDPTNLKFLRYVAIFVIYFTGILFGLLAFPSLKGVANTALGGAGVLALVLGVASQEALANIVGGIFIISFKPFKVNDLIQVTDTMVGTVTDITLRHTVIRNFDNKMIVIPNSIINKEKLINYDLGELKCCERIEIGISFDSDFILAKKIMREACEKHPLIYDNRSEMDKRNGVPLVKTGLTQINDYSLTIRAWAWGKNFNDCFQLKIDIYETVKTRFDEEGVKMPTPYRTVIMKDSEKSETDE